ncbi:MAG: hypothetical protein KTR17_03645 [Cellvibrionaceae bacterium]|nr:hypothetical protein [Cellvibrionaceae bacterium]
MIIHRYVFIACVFMGLWGCSSNEQRVKKELEFATQQVNNGITQLKQHLQAGRVRNAKLLKVYADSIKKNHPEYREIANLLAQDATVSGPIISALEQRLNDAKKQIPNAVRFPDKTRQLGQELNAIHAAADIQNFNLALTDPINVLADMSGGKLSRLSTAGTSADTSITAPVGSELIGNPNYGQWQTNSSGDTFWEWYGKYALISSLFDLASSGSFSGWSSNRRNSYYHDYGRDYYSSPSQKSNYQQAETRVKKQFSQQGKKFESPYARSKSTINSGKKDSVFKTPNKFKSSFSNSSKYANQPGKVQGQSNSAYNYRSKKTNSRSFGFGGK